MGQARLDRSFALGDAARSHRPSYFLALPSKLRHKIYLQAGLVSSQYIDLNYWAPFEHADEVDTTPDLSGIEEAVYQRQRSERNTSTALLLPLKLLLVCRTIYDELVPLIYGLNSFTISRHGPGGLGALGKFRGQALSSLQILTIHLNDCLSGYPATVLGSTFQGDKIALDEWARICTHLARHLSPSRLRLCIICDCEDLDTAVEVTRIALALPLLRDCAIRLSYGVDEKLRQLAKHTALRLTGRQEASGGTFPFLNLPREIQFQIMEYTGLVTNTIVEWGSFPTRFCDVYCDSELAGDFSVGGTDTELLGWENFVIDTHGPYLCGLNVAAYSSRCVCQTFPASYFLVSHEFRNLATEVFYSRNHFAIFHKDENFPPNLSHADPDCTSLSKFLSGIPRNGIRNLTKLSLVFPPFGLTRINDSQEGWESWSAGVNMLLRFASLNKLRIEIYFTSPYWQEFGYESEHEELFPTDDNSMIVAFEKVLGPLVVLRSVKCLGIHVPLPIGRSRAGERRDLENKLEMSVMGEGYDGKAAGKSRTYQYWWQRMYMDY